MSTKIAGIDVTYIYVLVLTFKVILHLKVMPANITSIIVSVSANEKKI